MALINAKSKRRLPVVLAGVILTATVAVSALPGTASAAYRRDDHHWHDWHHPWAGGYYAPPPVVYNTPYTYAAPPVVYGPGFGINLNIR